MALIAIASDKGAPGVTTAALALAAVWPRPVLLAECDPAGGDLVYRFPAVGGGHLDPRRGVLSLAVVARRGMHPQQVWEHAQKLHGGLDVLAGVTNAEQGAGLSLLWGPIGKVLASLPQADVIADCGRLGADGPLYDLLAEATTVVLVTKVHVADVIRLRDRAAAFAAAVQSRGRRGFGVGVVVVADHKKFRASLGEVQHVLGQANAPATVLGGIAHDPKGADLLSGEWGGNLDRTLLIKTAREVAQHLVQGLPPIGAPAAPSARPSTGPQPAAPSYPGPQPAVRPSTGPQPAVRPSTGPQPAVPSFTGPQPAVPSYAGPQQAVRPSTGPQPVAPSYAGPQQAVPPSADRPPVPAPAFPPSGSAPDLAAATLAAPTASAAPTVSAAAPRTTFSRVLGARSGRHAQGPAQPASAVQPATVPGPGSAFPRAPMAPLAPTAAPDLPENPANPQSPEEAGREAALWPPSPRPAASPGSMGSPPGGG